MRSPSPANSPTIQTLRIAFSCQIPSPLNRYTATQALIIDEQVEAVLSEELRIACKVAYHCVTHPAPMRRRNSRVPLEHSFQPGWLVLSYKAPAQADCAFRSRKTVDPKIRAMEWHLIEAWRPNSASSSSWSRQSPHSGKPSTENPRMWLSYMGFIART